MVSPALTPAARAPRNDPKGSGPANRRRPQGSVTGFDQVCDREEVLGQADLFTLIVIPALFTRILRARERGFGGMAELHVDHRDTRLEGHLVRILGAVARGRPLLEAPLVHPHLPQLTGAVEDIAVRHEVGFLVDEDQALAVGILWQLGHAFDDVSFALLPVVAENVIAAAAAVLHRERIGMEGGEDFLLAEELPIEPRNLTGIAAVAIDIGVLAEEGVRALRAGEAP